MILQAHHEAKSVLLVECGLPAGSGLWLVGNGASKEGFASSASAGRIAPHLISHRSGGCGHLPAIHLTALVLHVDRCSLLAMAADCRNTRSERSKLK